MQELACKSRAECQAVHFADFLTGIYHWGVDNYGSGETPIVGSQIAAFQGHHQKPWTITEREFCNNVHKVLQLLSHPGTPNSADYPYCPVLEAPRMHSVLLP